MSVSRFVLRLTLCFAGCLGTIPQFAFPQTNASLRISISKSAWPTPDARLTGHLVVVFSKTSSANHEPRDQVQEQYTSAQAFGLDVENLDPNGSIIVDNTTAGYPLRHLSDIPPGTYFVQAVLNVYEPFHLASGQVVWLPPDRGEGQHWNRKPGNPLIAPLKMKWPPSEPVNLSLNQRIPPVRTSEQILSSDPGAQKYLRFVHVRSEKLSSFWGRDIYLNAWILLPPGFEEHATARYPLIVFQDHFSESFGLPFQTMPPTADMPDRERNRALAGYQFYQDWTNGRMPHMLVVSIQNANPYYDDSYVMDSENIGPYGSAVTQELIPEIERKFRGIGQGWARATFGGSTGGWEALASQIFYPDFYNGTWAACPDPVDFHDYQNVNLYEDANAFFRQGDFGSIPIAADRKADGSILALTGEEVQFEYVLGTRGRSTEQWNIWQAVFSPRGADGYPIPIWNDQNGVIDKAIVKYWRDHWDLTAILQRDWTALGPKLEGKIHVQAGDGDTYFLNNAVHRMQQMLEDTRAPHSDAVFQFGAGAPHCYTGGPSEYTMVQNNRTWPQRVLPQMAAHMKAKAPAGADVKSWVY